MNINRAPSVQQVCSGLWHTFKPISWDYPGVRNKSIAHSVTLCPIVATDSPICSLVTVCARILACASIRTAQGTTITLILECAIALAYRGQLQYTPVGFTQLSGVIVSNSVYCSRVCAFAGPGVSGPEVTIHRSFPGYIQRHYEFL